MSTDHNEGGFEPWFVSPRTGGPDDSSVQHLWPRIECFTGHRCDGEERETQAADPATEAKSLFFDENEVAKLCAAAAAGARSQALAEEIQRFREELMRLGLEVRKALAAFFEQRRRVLRESRQRAGQILAEAFVKLAPHVLRETQKIQLAREISGLLPLFDSSGRLRLRVAAGLAEPLAAALHPLARNGLALEVMEEGSEAAGSFCLELGETLLECDPAGLVERIAEALRRVLIAEEGPVAASASIIDLPERCLVQPKEQRDGA